MAPLLSMTEAQDVADAFLIKLYGEEVFEKWKYLKTKLQFQSERDYAIWLLELAYHAADSIDDSMTEQTIPDLQEQHLADLQDQQPAAEQITIKHEQMQLQQQQQQYQQHGYCNGAASEAGDFERGGVVPVWSGGGITNDNAAAVVVGNSFVDATGMMVAGGVTATPLTGVKGGKKRRSKEVRSPRGGMPGVVAVTPSFEASPTMGGTPGSGATTDNRARHACPACSYSSAHQHHLKRHYDEVHRRTKPHACPYCEFTSSRKEHLKQHVNRKHQSVATPPAVTAAIMQQDGGGGLVDATALVVVNNSSPRPSTLAQQQPATTLVATTADSESLTATLEMELQKLQAATTGPQ